MHSSEKLLNTESGNAVIVAMDHGVLLGATQGFSNPEATLKNVLTAKPDGLLLGANFAYHFKEELESASNLSLTLAGDMLLSSVIPGEYGNLEYQTQLHNVADLAALGADAIKTLLIFGKEDPEILLENATSRGCLTKQRNIASFSS